MSDQTTTKTTQNVIPLRGAGAAAAAAEETTDGELPADDFADLIAANERKKARRAEQRAHDNSKVAYTYGLRKQDPNNRRR